MDLKELRGIMPPLAKIQRYLPVGSVSSSV